MVGVTSATKNPKVKPVTVGSLFGSTSAIGSSFRRPNLLENTISPIVDKEPNSYEALLFNRTKANLEEMAFVGNLANLVKIKPSIDANSCLSFYEPELSQPKVVDEKKNKREQEKLHVLKEIIASERKYLNDINEIVEVGVAI